VDVEAAEQALEEEQTVPALLRAAARLLVEATGAHAAAVSRLVGELIVDMANFTRDGRSLVLGYGYLVSDFPLTKEVVERREPRTVALDDDSADEKEVALLNELGYASLLMLPLERAGQSWGLVELYYVAGSSFGDGDIELARRLVQRTAELLDRIEAPTPS
jgi:GAF domain-containing protein